MARSRYSRQRGRRSAPRRKFIWAESHGQLTTGSEEEQPDYQTQVNLLAEFQEEYGAQIIGATVVRIRGWIAPRPIADLTDQAAFWSAGALIDDDYSQSLVAADRATQQMSPFNAPNADWLMWQCGFVPASVEGVQPDVTSMPGSPYQVDNKSSRKLEELGQGLYLHVGTEDFTGAVIVPMNFLYCLRIGLKLP